MKWGVFLWCLGWSILFAWLGRFSQSVAMIVLACVIYYLAKYQERLRQSELKFWAECQSKIAAFKKEHKL